MYMEPTGLDEACRLFRVRKSRPLLSTHCRLILLQVTDAFIGEAGHLLPENIVERTEISPPGLELPRLRCYLRFKHEDSIESDYGRFQAWCIEDLRELWYNMDKAYSRAASRVAISQLMNEINVVREPLRAEEKFQLLVTNQAMVQALLDRVRAGSEGSLEQRFGELLRLIMMENGGSAF